MNNFKQVLSGGILTIITLLTLGTFATGAVPLLKGQTIYVPCYSNVVSEINRILLKANLIIHNTDPVNPIRILRIDNYDTQGKLVEHYLSQPIQLGPLSATRVMIKEPKKGEEGAGANFIVQWKADQKVTEPLVDCIMVGSLGTQGYSFSSQGRVIKEEAD